MQYINVQEAAALWGITPRRVQELCRVGKVMGAERFGRSWMIPSNAARPADSRLCRVRENAQDQLLLLRQTPFLNMTDLYHTPGHADECLAMIQHPRTKALLEAQIAYARGDIDFVYRRAEEFLAMDKGFYAIISGGILLGMSAVWRGDVSLWQKAKRHILEAPYQSESSPDIIALSIAALESFIRKSEGYPDWFIRGSFEHLPPDAHPAALVYYASYLIVQAHELAIGNCHFSDVTGLGLMKTIPFIVEPLIAFVHTQRVVIAEIYLRLLCGIAYRQISDLENATKHTDCAIDLCLADGLLVPLVEHRRQFGTFLDARLEKKDPQAYARFKELHKNLRVGWSVLHNTELGRRFAVAFSSREFEVAVLAAFGLTDKKIAEKLFLSESSVKSIIRSAKNKCGVQKRRDFSDFI